MYTPMECTCPVCEGKQIESIIPMSIESHGDMSQVEGQCPVCGFEASFSLDNWFN